MSCLPHELAVGVDLPIRAEVADHVPVQTGLVPAAELLEARAECEVHGAADLLVEEDVARESVDLVVQTKRRLAEDARPRVHVEERLDERVSVAGFGVDDATALEAQPNVLHPTPLEDRRKREANLAFRLRLERAREDLAVGHVQLAVGGEPIATGDIDAQVCVRPDDPQLRERLQLARTLVQLNGDPAPVCDGVLVSAYVARPVDEVLVLSE